MDVEAPTRLVIIEGTAGDDGESGRLRREVGRPPRDVVRVAYCSARGRPASEGRL